MLPPCAVSFRELVSILAKGSMASARSLFSEDRRLIIILMCTLRRGKGSRAGSLLFGLPVMSVPMTRGSYSVSPK